MKVSIVNVNFCQHGVFHDYISFNKIAACSANECYKISYKTNETNTSLPEQTIVRFHKLQPLAKLTVFVSYD